MAVAEFADRGVPSVEETAFDYDKYGSKVGWSRKCMIVDGRKIVITSGEFQYWRVPDVSRWKQILLQYKALGLNAVRFYFHWGWHCPGEGKFVSDGNRDVEHLFKLCEELEMFVIVAPGPYICAETQGGGYPSWVVAHRELRIRHLRTHFIKKFDPALAELQNQWYKYIVPIIVRHERTTNPSGCVILFQVENELLHRVGPITFADDEEMRSLAKTARSLGSTLPFFHNDDMPHGSWNSGNKNHYFRHCLFPSSPSYRTDLYGVDKYFVFAPTDSRADASSLSVGPFQFGGFSAFLEFFGIGGLGIGGDQNQRLACLFRAENAPVKPPPEGWTFKQFSSAIDVLEGLMDGMKGASAGGPAVMAEMQVGWINQWARMRDYDDLYSYFGDNFSSTLHTSLSAQGLTVINYYTVYGGTNFGCSGDSEVYTSYDYSGYIREFGMTSERGRRLRLKMLFQRAFVKYGLAETQPEKSAASCSKPDMLLNCRRAVRGEGGESLLPRYIFLRHFVRDSADKKVRFTFAYGGVALPCELSPRQSFTVPANIAVSSALRVHLCNLQVITRAEHEGAELWTMSFGTSPIGRVVLRATDEITTLSVKWASVDGTRSGTVTASRANTGAKESLWKAPLEELSQRDFESRPENGSDTAPASIQASTEPVAGACFTVGFAEPCAVAVCDEQGTALFRVLVISESDARTFTAQLDSTSDMFAAKAPTFACAWGANDLAISPGGALSISRDVSDTKVYYIGAASAAVPEGLSPSAETVRAVMPGLSEIDLPTFDLENVCPGGKNYVLPMEPWARRKIDWQSEVSWKAIEYSQRDPLDHLYTSGCISYRCDFEANPTAKVTMTLNIRHVGMVYCDGRSIEGQFCYSHNALSAGAMHAVDFTWAGKKTLNLSPFLNTTSNSHHVIIVVHNLGMGRQPFLLNDVRNRRGLLSAKLSRSARNLQWKIYGVPVSELSDPFNTTGLPLENEVTAAAENTSSRPWEPSNWESPYTMQILAEHGVHWLRTSFVGPPAGIKFPLDLKFETTGSMVIMAWVNQLFIGRYLPDFGPQSDFYVPEGVVECDKENSLVLGILPLKDSTVHVSLGPWVVDIHTGNRSADGEPFVLQTIC